MKKLLLLFFLTQQFLNAEFNTTLSQKDIERIDKYVENVSIEDSIGQLFMVGIDNNYLNNQNSSDITSLIKELGVGFVFITKDNYLKNKDKETYLNRAIDFNNFLQEKASESNLGLPLLIAADFESPRFSSIKYGLHQPLPALTLGATHNGELIKNNAILNGLELKNLGIDILLGPVLDRYDINIGEKEKELINRSFSSDKDSLIKFSSHYINGLKESGIITFAKHFPSNGKVDKNTHSYDLPNYKGSKEEFKTDLQPFKVYKKTIDGVMLSHMSVSSLDIKLPASLSSKFINNHVIKKDDLSLGFNNTIIITDDLSSMKSIKYFHDKNHISYPEIGRNAFMAGNDILLFSYTCRQRSNCKSYFSIETLKKVKVSILKYVEQNNQKRFRKSLKKIILLKSKIAKQKGINIKTFLSKSSIFRNENSGSKVLEKSEAFIKEGNFTYKNAKELQEETLKQATILINNKTLQEINSKLLEGKKILFMVNDSQLNKFETNFANFTADFNTTNWKKYGSFKKYQNYLKNSIGKYDYLIYILHNKSDVDAIEAIRLKNKKLLNKVIIFVHDNPSILTEEILNNTTIISSFTLHPLSYNNDIAVLKGIVKPKELKYLPIELGKFFKVPSSELTRAEGGSFNYDLISSPLFKKLQKLQKEIKALEKTLNTTSTKLQKENHKIEGLNKTIEDLNKTIQDYDFFSKAHQIN